MRLEDYFDFRNPTDIRLKDANVGIEIILSAYLDLALLADEIPGRYPPLTLEEVYATLTYYWRNQAAMDAYLRRVRDFPGRLPATGGVAVLPAARRLLEMAARRDEFDRDLDTPRPDAPADLEDYFDFLLPLDIRIRGSRIGIETILWDYRNLGLYAEDIAVRYRTLSLEQVYATITYYLHNRERVDAYLYQVEAEIKRQREEFERDLPPGIARLRELSRQRAEERQRVLASIPL